MLRLLDLFHDANKAQHDKIAKEFLKILISHLTLEAYFMSYIFFLQVIHKTFQVLFMSFVGYAI